MLWLIGWYLLGMLGCYLGWRVDAYDACPTPKHIALWILLSLGGVFALIVASVTWLFTWLENLKYNHNSWWNKPICRGRRR